MNRSSYTRVPSSGSASSLAIQPRSSSDFVITADEEMYTIPASSTAGRSAPKTSQPRTSPTPKFARSIVPAVPICRRRASSRSRLNSRPRKKRRKTIPSSAPSEMNSVSGT